MTQTTLTYYICSILAFIPALVLHEVAHGYVAYKLGDPTAKRQGRLSLNPLKHIDIFGTILLPFMLMIMNMPIFGYAKPVPYDPTYFKDTRKGDCLVGLAGPIANLLMALLGAVVMHILYMAGFSIASNQFLAILYYYFLPQFIYVNLVFMFFNLIPIPPLDGSSIIALFIPIKYLPKWYSIQSVALPILMILMIALPYIFNISPFSAYIGATAGNLFNLLIP